MGETSKSRFVSCKFGRKCGGAGADDAASVRATRASGKMALPSWWAETASRVFAAQASKAQTKLGDSETRSGSGLKIDSGSIPVAAGTLPDWWPTVSTLALAPPFDTDTVPVPVVSYGAQYITVEPFVSQAEECVESGPNSAPHRPLPIVLPHSDDSASASMGSSPSPTSGSDLTSPIGTKLLHRKVAKQTGVIVDNNVDEESADPNQLSSPCSTELMHRKVNFQQRVALEATPMLPSDVSSPIGKALMDKKMKRQSAPAAA